MRIPKVYVGFSIADSMFTEGDCLILRRQLELLDFKKYMQKGAISYINPAYKNSIAEIEKRYTITLPPHSDERVKLQKGDSIIVISSRGLPRKTGGAFKYTPEEISRATFNFSIYTLLESE